MVDETGLRDHLADLAASGQRFAVPLAAGQIRARGNQRRRRKQAALTSGGMVLTAALAVESCLWSGSVRSRHRPPRSRQH